VRPLIDPSELDRLIESLATSIDQRMRGDAEASASWALVGIRSRGDELARRLADRLGRERLAGRVGSLDITLYRDDVSEIGPKAVVRTTDLPFALDGLNVVLMDDVLMTGRSIHATLTSLVDLGRPRRVWLAVLVDRGGRELPLAPDFAGLDLTDADGAKGGRFKQTIRCRCS